MIEANPAKAKEIIISERALILGGLVIARKSGQ